MEAIKFRRRYGVFHGVKDIQSLCSPVSFLLLLVSKKQKTKNKQKKKIETNVSEDWAKCWWGDALHSFLVKQILKALIQFRKKDQGFTGAHQENFERMRTSVKTRAKMLW